MIVVAIIAFLAVIAIPSFMKSRMVSHRSACIHNLRLIDHAKQQYATDGSNGVVAETNVPPAEAINSYFRNGAPVCAAGGTYIYGAIHVLPVCSLAAAPNSHALPATAN